MRKAKYSLKKVVCPNAHCLGDSSNIAKPGYWVTYRFGSEVCTGRVLGRIDETDNQGDNCAGRIALICLYGDLTAAGISWVDPKDVVSCTEKPPKELMAWITGDEWVKNKADIARILAMGQHGTLSERYIASRDEADKPYNSWPEYCQQYILK